MERNVLLEMEGIDKSFPGVKALDQVSITLEEGEVLALLGENGAGKSTLMKCLFGTYSKDAGTIKIDGEEVDFKNAKHALDNGVAMVHQELNQVLRRSVMENIWLGRFPKKNGLIDHKKMYDETIKIFEDLKIDVNPRTMIGTLSVSQRQMIEIAKAASYGARIVVLDEPTSSLNEEEVEQLFEIIRRLTSNGVGIIYISHKLEEIKIISDRVTIMRDGQWINTSKIEDVTIDEIISMMVNRDLGDRFPPKTNKIGDVLLSAKNITGKYEPTCKDVSFDLHKGEILGVAGLVGSRRTELLETIFGVATIDTGELYLHGKQINNNTTTQAINNGFALVTEERRATGIFPEADITFNTTISNIKDYSRYGLLSPKGMYKDTYNIIDQLNVKTPTKETFIKALSGGNQQKVIIGRGLLTEPEVLLLDEPTRGIDVGAKYEIYQLIIDLAKEGKGIIMVSSEMPELIGICDRILVMSNGHLAGTLSRDEDFGDDVQEKIMHLTTKYL